jgi:hypothetical protein
VEGTVTHQPNVVIIHDGDQDYLRTALDRARRAGNTVAHLRFARMSPGWLRFEAAYRHMSTHARIFELRCFQRFFVMQQLMQDQGLDGFFHVDSDVLLFDDLHAFEVEHIRPQAIACGLHMPLAQPGFRYSYGPQTSYWTRAAVDDFCRFLIASFENLLPALADKWAWHQQTGAAGGICDMALLYLWARDRGDIANFAAVIGGGVFDLNINSGENLVKDEYETRLGRKHIVFREGRPWCRNLKSGEWVRFRSLHFQGHIKAQMARVAQGRGIAATPILKENAKNLARLLLRRG